MRQLLLCASTFVLAAGLASAQAPATHYTAATQTWDLTNSAMKAQFTLTPSGVFQFVSFSTVGGDVQILAPDGAAVTPIQMVLDGNPIDETTPWTLVRTFQSSSLGNSLARGVRRTIRLQNVALGVQVDVYFEVHPNQPFFRYWLDVVNQSPDAHVLTSLSLLNWQWQTAGQNFHAFYVNQYRQNSDFLFNITDVDLTTQPSGATVYSGAHADHIGWIATAFPGGNGLVAGWEFDGRAHITAKQSTGGSPVTLNGGPDDLRLTIAAGHTQTLPAAFLGLFQGDWDEAGYRTQRYMEAVLAQPVPDENFPYVAYDTWAYVENFNQGSLKTMADKAHSVGVELFIVDLGWTRSIGDWQYNRGKFPDGLKSFSDYVHSLGMKIGLHWTPAEAAPTSPAMTQHPDYAATEPSEYFGATGLCLGNTATQSWARTMISDMVTNYNFDWLTQDGENLVKECTKTTHSHDPANSNWSNSVEGIDALVEGMRTKHPNLLWENNADGGDMLTFQMVKNYVTAASCDGCSEPLQIQSTFGQSFPFSPRYIDRYVAQTPSAWTIRANGFGGPLILMEKTNWTTAQKSLLAAEIGIYKSLRTLIRDGKVYHLGPAPSYASNSSIESYNAAMDAAVVFVYRPGSANASLRVNPRGLNLASFYTVRFQNTGESSVLSGAEIMSTGFNVKLAAENTAEIIYIDPLIPHATTVLTR